MTTSVSATGPTAAAPQASEQARLQKVAKQFEAVFLRQMIGSMRQANLGEGAFDSSATEQFRSMADAKTADSMAETGGFGVADLLTRQFAARAASGTTAKAPAPPAVESPK